MVTATPPAGGISINPAEQGKPFPGLLPAAGAVPRAFDSPTPPWGSEGGPLSKGGTSCLQQALFALEAPPPPCRLRYLSHWLSNLCLQGVMSYNSH